MAASNPPVQNKKTPEKIRCFFVYFDRLATAKLKQDVLT
jgi:hypothetical protein